MQKAVREKPKGVTVKSPREIQTDYMVRHVGKT
jgi:hypothetical protein